MTDLAPRQGRIEPFFELAEQIYCDADHLPRPAQELFEELAAHDAAGRQRIFLASRRGEPRARVVARLSPLVTEGPNDSPIGFLGGRGWGTLLHRPAQRRFFRFP